MRPQETRAWHYIKPNETTRMPRRHVFIDTEARTSREGKTHEQEWRLGVAIYAEGRKGAPRKFATKDYFGSGDLWADVSSFAQSGARTIVWAHNVGYDIRISGMLAHLPQMGWSLVAHNVSAHGTWLEWRRDKATILVADSSAVFPTTIAKMGEWFGLAKPYMAIDSDSDEAWLERCRIDCEILQRAVCAYLDWLESADMGNWQLTGSGQSWASFRHRFLTHKLCVHDDAEALTAERRAMWTGRCEAYWHGEIPGEPIYEFDFTNSYARIARDYSVPVKLIGELPDSYDWRTLLHRERSGLLADVSVKTALPVVPTRHEGRILWPTGEFKTTLWDVEIQSALQNGASIQVDRGWVYRKNPALTSWGTWILETLHADDSKVPVWQKAILKHWSRALIGRMAMTYRQWEEYATLPDSRVMVGTLFDRDSGEECDIMQVGNTMWRDAGRVEWVNSMPMVTGYIQAIARVQLWDIISQMPPRSVVYADTDSIFVTGTHYETLTEIASRYQHGTLRLKRIWDGFAIYGPRQIVTGEQVRISGIPRRAGRLGGRRFAGEVWDTLSGSMKRGAFNKVITRDREWNVEGIDRRRQGTGFGWTEPIRISPADPGSIPTVANNPNPSPAGAHDADGHPPAERRAEWKASRKRVATGNSAEPVPMGQGDASL